MALPGSPASFASSSAAAATTSAVSPGVPLSSPNLSFPTAKRIDTPSGIFSRKGLQNAVSFHPIMPRLWRDGTTCTHKFSSDCNARGGRSDLQEIWWECFSGYGKGEVARERLHVRSIAFCLQGRVRKCALERAMWCCLILPLRGKESWQ